MTWAAPWRQHALATCRTHQGPEPYRVIASTLDDRERCVQCVKREREEPDAPEPTTEETEAAMQLFEEN